MIFVVYYQISYRLSLADDGRFSDKMIKSNASYQNCAVGRDQLAGEDRLPLGSALLAVFGLSLLAWAVVIIPLVAIFYD